MNLSCRRRVLCAAAVLAVMLGSTAEARPAQLTKDAVAEVQRAIREQRLLDAGKMLDEAQLAGVKDPQLPLLGGDLNLARGRYNAALGAYRTAGADPTTRAAALEGEGITLARMGRADEAAPVLRQAVKENPQSWRAWNALGSNHDDRGEWALAATAYEHALAASDQAAIVLNNRGYSYLLQARYPAAISDFVAALRKRPDLAEARTNLRLAMAMQGEYQRAVAGGAPSEQAALLNNAGFSAALRGDYAEAEALLKRAVAARGEYYARASENLKIVQALASQKVTSPDAHR